MVGIKTLMPRYFAIAQYTVLSIFLWASWVVLLLPLNNAIGLLMSMFAQENINRIFFIFFAIAPLIATFLSIAFCFSRSSLSPLSTWLVIVAAINFVVAIWLFDYSLILGFGLGFVFSVWSRYAPVPSESPSSAL